MHSMVSTNVRVEITAPAVARPLYCSEFFPGIYKITEVIGNISPNNPAQKVAHKPIIAKTNDKIAAKSSPFVVLEATLTISPSSNAGLVVMANNYK